eukprot:231847_1
MARLSAFLLTTMTLHIELILCTQYRNGDVSSPFIFYLDDYILSHGGLARLMLQGGDGNLVMRQYASSSWSYGGWATGTDPNGDHVELQEDGGLVVFDATGGVLWQSNSITGTSPYRLIVTDDAELYTLDSVNKIVWSTNPSFVRLQTIWTEPFNSNDTVWYTVGPVAFTSPSIHCPNYPDLCVEVKWHSTPDNCCWVGKWTNISMYSALQLQVDISGYDLESYQDNGCLIYWQFSGFDWILYGTQYPDGVSKDVIIDIPLNDSYTCIAIDLQILGDGDDICYFDNAILRGILRTSNPTDVPTSRPTLSTADPTTNRPTDVPTSRPTLSTTNHPSNHPSTLPTINHPSNHPSTDPTTNHPSNHPSTLPTGLPSTTPVKNPVLVANIPSHHEPSNSIAITYENTSSEIVTTDHIESDGNDSNEVSTMQISTVIVSISIVFVAVVMLAVVCATKQKERKRSKVEIQAIISEGMDVERIEQEEVITCSPAPPIDEVNRCDVENEDRQTLGGEDNVVREDGEKGIGTADIVVREDDESESSSDNDEESSTFSVSHKKKAQTTIGDDGKVIIQCKLPPQDRTKGSWL